MTLILFVKEEKELIIISKEYVYSVYHSDNYETIDIELLTNNKEDYHFEKDYIISSKIYNQNQELSVSITKISTYNEAIILLDQEFNQVMIELELPFVSNDYLVEIEDAFLEIIYDNNESINISIGEINYLFLDNYGRSISLGNLSATHEEYLGVNTIGGVNLELGNQTNHNINITNIDIISNSIHINKDYIKEREACEYTNIAKTCLDIEYNVLNAPLSEEEVNILLGKNSDISLYLPLTYNGKYNFIYEFALLIDYEVNGIKERLVIDDFPFMSTSIFSSFSEDDIHVYTIQH
jgi:hypothetical protein